jgi:Caspase domain
MKRALLVGIDKYDRKTPLYGCVNDVQALHPLLARNEDNTLNFECQIRNSASRRQLRSSLDALLAPGADVALFYFAGHGAAVPNDVVLVCRDGQEGELGIPLSEILGKVQSSSVPEVLILLDCCFGGAGGGVPQLGGNAAVLRNGVSILTASRGDQRAEESPQQRGLFSSFVQGALDGGAADTLGHVTTAGMYAYLSESFGAWKQRPTFKTNVDRLHVLRRCRSAVPLVDLQRLPKIFASPEVEFPLDPSYEFTAEPRNAEHEEIFQVLQRCHQAKLVEPVGTEHMYFAAMESRSCRLTPLGRHYWRLAHEERV